MSKIYCSKPCAECPFRKTSLRGWLGEFTAEETLAAALSEDDFDCHLTRDEEEYERKHCAGRMLLASYSAKRFRDLAKEEIRKIIVELNPYYREEILSAQEFLKHHRR